MLARYFRLNLGSLLALVSLLVLEVRTQAVAQQGIRTGSIEEGQSPAPVDEWLFMGDAFEGTFIQLENDHRDWSQQRWETEFVDLRRIGFKTLIIQWTEYDGFGFVDSGNNGRRTIERLAAAADKMDFELYVGLSVRKKWWNIEELDFRFLLEELSRNSEVADLLYPVLEQHTSFRGWYIPHEVTDLHFTDQQWELVLEFYSQLTGHLRRLDPLKPVAAAGYTDPEEAQFARFGFRLADFLSRSGVDIFIFQDGAGRSNYRNWRDTIPFYEALVAMDDAFEGDIWVLAEVFTQTDGPPISDTPFAAEPANIDRVIEQMEALSALQKKMVVYDYFSYMRPSRGEKETILYEAYRAHISEMLAGMKSDQP